MRIVIVGGGAREHAIALAFKNSKSVSKILAIPGNPGIAKIAECKNIPIDDLENIVLISKNFAADLVFIGPELPLVLGLKDKLDKENIKSFGPSLKAAQLEGSKIFSRNFCKKYKIPQPKFFTCYDLIQAKEAIKFFKGNCVVKADGLAAGKGVIVCNDILAAEQAAKSMLVEKKFSSAGEKILIEELLSGVEASIFSISDGVESFIIGTAQDYKRAFNDDKGPNTGGMGAVSPAPSLDKIELEKINKEIIMPTINGMIKEKSPYTGILYAGIMKTNKGSKLIEFNCRFGDPETQVIIPRLKCDFLELILSSINKGKPFPKKILNDNVSITVVLANKGYPEKIENVEELPKVDFIDKLENIFLFHAGTSIDVNNKLVASGGRVISVTGVSKNIEKSRKLVYDIINKIKWKNVFYRTDIGKFNI